MAKKRTTLKEMKAFHPRAMKLLDKQKNFLVVAEDEPYFMKVYGLIRTAELKKRTWSSRDEILYQNAKRDHGKLSRGG